MRKAVRKSSESPLSEQDIRRLSIGFLRTYYRDEARKQPIDRTAHSEDEMALWEEDQNWTEYSGQTFDKPHVFKNGITIDARITYQRQDGSNFIATVEATDLKRRSELDYRFNWLAILQDGLGFAVIFTALYLVLPQVGGTEFALDLLTRAGRVSLFTTFLLLLLIYFMVAHRRVAYRYIYAVNQFRRFYADHQWVAFDAELYPEPTDPKMLELQRQCTRYGLGMLIVEADRSVRLQMAPSRMDMFKGRRKLLPSWVTQVPENKMLGGIKQQSSRLIEQAKSASKKAKALPLPSSLVPKPLTKKTESATDQLGQQVGASAPDAWPATRGSLPAEATQAGTEKENLSSAQAAAEKDGPIVLAKELTSKLRRKFQIRVNTDDAPRFYRFRWWAIGGFLLGLLVVYAVYLEQDKETNFASPTDAMSVQDLNMLEVDTFLMRRMRPDQNEIEEELHMRREGLAPDPDLAIDDAPLNDLREESLILGGTDLYSYRLNALGQSDLGYDCTPLYTQPDLLDRYLIVIGSYTRFSPAREAARAWYARTGKSVTVIRTSCLTTDPIDNFIIYVSDPIGEIEQLQFEQRELEELYGGALKLLQIR
ncbi:MAG: hypothetical protein AAF741_16520 [Bacteroidota bacterium]